LQTQIADSIKDIALAMQQIILLLQPSWIIQGLTIAGTIATAISAIATLVLAWLTRNMVKEMKDTREETFRPYVIVDYEENEGSMYLSIRNIGQTMAKNVSVKIEKPIKGAVYQEDLRQKMFGEPMPSIAPGWHYRTYINEIGIMDSSNDYSTKQKVDISYFNSAGKIYNDSHILNLDLYHQKTYQLSNDTKKTKSLEEISEGIKIITKNHDEVLEGKDAVEALFGKK